MVRTLLFIIVVVCSISACKKQNVPPIMPVAKFTLAGDTSRSLTIGPYDQYSLINTSTDADSFIWDFGNGITSKDKETVLSYPKSGTYTLTLTSINRNGMKSVASKTVRVVDPILKQVVIKSLNLNHQNRPANWPVFTKANVWVEIVKAAPDQDYPVLSNGVFDAPVVYKSSVASNVDFSSVPIIFNVPQKFIIDIPTLTRQHGYEGIGYGFNLYAQDATGTYLLSSNFWSGVNCIYRGSIPNNTFTINTDILGCLVEFHGTYE